MITTGSSTGQCVDRNTILFISGVPGLGKTTLSYELLKRYDKFRIIQETDIIREILRGYNEYIEYQMSEVDIAVIDIILQPFVHLVHGNLRSLLCCCICRGAHTLLIYPIMVDMSTRMVNVSIDRINVLQTLT